MAGGAFRQAPVLPEVPVRVEGEAGAGVPTRHQVHLRCQPGGEARPQRRLALAPLIAVDAVLQDRLQHVEPAIAERHRQRHQPEPRVALAPVSAAFGGGCAGGDAEQRRLVPARPPVEAAVRVLEQPVDEHPLAPALDHRGRREPPEREVQHQAVRRPHLGDLLRHVHRQGARPRRLLLRLERAEGAGRIGVVPRPLHRVEPRAVEVRVEHCLAQSRAGVPRGRGPAGSEALGSGMRVDDEGGRHLSPVPP